MSLTDKKLLCDIAKQYYEDGRTQAEIAQAFGISRPIVSRKLAEAKERGIVKVFVDKYEDDMSELERGLFSAFDLRGLRVSSVPEDDRELGIQITSSLGAQYISEFIEPGDCIGVGWGWTLYELSNHMQQQNISVDVVCQLTGSVDNAMTRGYSNEIVSNISRKLNAKNAYIFPCPVMVDTSVIFDALRHDLKVRKVLDFGRRCNKIFINIALPDQESCLYQAGYLNDDELNHLTSGGAVGSVCCRFFDENGNVCDEEIDERTIGISIEDIRNADCVFACLTGRKKARAIYAALKSGLIDVLVIDSLTAAEVLKLVDANAAKEQ